MVSELRLAKLLNQNIRILKIAILCVFNIVML